MNTLAPHHILFSARPCDRSQFVIALAKLLSLGLDQTDPVRVQISRIPVGNEKGSSSALSQFLTKGDGIK